MAAVIVSDVHCDGPDSPTQRAFLAFLDRVPADVVVAAGDVFHAFAAPRGEVFAAYAPVVAALARRELVVLPGNHDWLLGPALGRGGVAIGTQVRAPIGGLAAVITHGDEVDESVSYRAFHAGLRHAAFTRLLDRLGPARAWGLLHRLAGPLGHGRPSPALVAAQRALAARRLGGAELAVMGHTHQPELRRIGGGWFLNPGDWVTHRTYGWVDGGEVSLRRWDG